MQDSDLCVGATRIWSIDVPADTLNAVCIINQNDTNLQTFGVIAIMLEQSV